MADTAGTAQITEAADTAAATARTTAATAVADAHRREWARVLAATVRVARDLDLAEECVQEAYAEALQSWSTSSVPNNPAAWLTTTAKRRAIDAIRRDAALRSKLPLLIDPDNTTATATFASAATTTATVDNNAARQQPTAPTAQDTEETLTDAIPDERLRLIFTCCHPALAQEAQAALTLRLVCGVPTPDIARVFLVSEPTVAARITRAKKKISTTRIPYRIPRPVDLPERLRAVLAVIHLLYTTGHTAPSGTSLIHSELADRALHLARMLRELMPDDTEVRGLYALLLVTDARRATRIDQNGRLIRLKDQDRKQWDQAALTEAHDIIVDCLTASPPRRYVLQAAIASLYAEAPTYDRTDWPQIVALYDKLLEVWPSPVVALNRAVPLSMSTGPQAALAEVEKLERDHHLSGYHYLYAIKADLLSRLDRPTDAADAYRQAFALAANAAERAFLAEQLPTAENA
jgi:RNA polymerase sigma factor (sigma-70 family)